MADKLAPEKHHSFIHGGQKASEWDQTLDEINMYITLPPNVPKKLFYYNVQSKHIELGIKGNPPYLNHDLTCPVKTDLSFWTLEDDIMHITLQKREKGQTWASPILGLGQGQLDPYATYIEQKRLMLQRFQEELAFTGSTDTGKIVLNMASKSNLKPTPLELGGRSPFIVCEDTDINRAVELPHLALFFNQGQCCCAGSRTFVHERVYDKFVEKARARALRRVVGDPFKKGVEQGPQIDSKQFIKIMKYIKAGIESGATLESGDRR